MNHANPRFAAGIDSCQAHHTRDVLRTERFGAGGGAFTCCRCEGRSHRWSGFGQVCRSYSAPRRITCSTRFRLTVRGSSVPSSGVMSPDRFAMQKVVGSSPIIRLKKAHQCGALMFRRCLASTAGGFVIRHLEYPDVGVTEAHGVRRTVVSALLRGLLENDADITVSTLRD
jgi:hypothetical protein